jgi:hypothetical protein
MRRARQCVHESAARFLISEREGRERVAMLAALGHPFAVPDLATA